jgi:hypothetical protein
MAGQTADRGLTGSILSILEHSAGIFWQQPVAPDAAAEQQVAAVVAVAPDGRSEAPDAAVAAGPHEAAAARPSGAAAAQASPSAEPDAAGVAVAQPGEVAQPVEFAAEAVAQPAEPALEARLRILGAAAAVAAVEHLAVAPLPGRPALLQAPEPNRQLAADPQQVPAPLPAPLAHRLLPGDSGPPEASSRADLAGQVWRSDSAHLEQVPSRRGAPEAFLGCLGLAKHWSSVTPGLEAAHWGLRWWATAYLARLADQTACRACLAWPRD